MPVTNAIVLEQLKLRYFKGAVDFQWVTNGGDVDIYGDNATCKTTQFDAFTWLMFDKDSQNKKDFDIKTLDSIGKPLSNLEHSVEGVLLISGKKKTLRKVYTEKWTRKRGSATDEFTGHETAYYIDEVPVKKSEYTAFVDSVMNEEVFKLLTNPSYFNEVLDWKKRRKTLLEVCGDVSNEDVIAGNSTLSKLPGILGDRSIEDHRKVIAAKRTEINKEIEKIPVRIDEAVRSKPDLGGLNEEQIHKQLAALNAHIESKQAELTRIQSGGEISVKENRLREIEGEMLRIKNSAQAASVEKVGAQRQVVANIQNQISTVQIEMQQVERQIASKKVAISDDNKQREQLRERWSTVNAEVFEQHNHEENCPTCGQSLPEEKINEALQTAVAAFNRSKSDRLADISTKGKALKEGIERLEQEVGELNWKLVDLQEKAANALGDLTSANDLLNKLQAGIQDVTAHPAYIQKQQEKQVIEQELLGLRSSSLDNLQAVRDTLSKLRMDSEKLEQSRSKLTQVAVIDQRIEDLKQQEKSLAAEYERLESELYLTEEFIRTKVSMLESKINSKFKHVQFKLFEQQINGGLEEKCETMVNGVPYSTGLNRAAQINGGLDIINTLSEHYGISAPIFIDNAEAVTQLIETNGQQVRLIVSEPDKQLRIVTKSKSDLIVVDCEVVS